MDGYRQSKTYIDFIVNGKSLADVFDIDKRDLISMLSIEDIQKEPPKGRDILIILNDTELLIHELTFKFPCRFEFRRVHIYGCPECGDLWCGNVTFQLIENLILLSGNALIMDGKNMQIICPGINLIMMDSFLNNGKKETETTLY